jgi:hypothetical protein
MNLDKLEDLKRQIAEAADFKDPFNYFLDHFGDREEFHDIGERTSHPKLEQMLEVCAATLAGPRPRVDNFLIIRVLKQSFLHGICRVNVKAANFIYFEDVQLGLLAILPASLDGATQIMRFTAQDLPRGSLPSAN